MEHTLTNAEINGKNPLRMALTRAGQALRSERESTARITLTASSPLSQKLAFDLHTYGLRDAAVVPMFGLVDEAVVADMARALRSYARELDQHRTPTLETLCAHALFAAGLIDVKERSEFFERLK